MNYDFDTIIDRGSTDSLKWAGRGLDATGREVLPLWVADMDFPCAPEIVKAVAERAAHPVYGYPLRSEGYYGSIVRWMERRHGWSVRPEWILYAPGVVPAFHLAVRAYSRPGDSVAIQTPVYGPFASAALKNNRKLVQIPLASDGRSYRMDFDALERGLDDSVRIFLLCSPHNPVGRVWSREELSRLLAVCAKKDIIVVSDEIHSDLVLGSAEHLCAASLPEAAGRVVTLMAPNKTFNIAGLTMACFIAQDERLREAYKAELESAGLEVSNVFGNVALEAAYAAGEPWLEALLEYLRGNLDFIEGFIAEKLPELNLYKPEGTYLAWIDFRSFGKDCAALSTWLKSEAGLWLDPGSKFVSGGEGFMRLNFACPRAMLVEAMRRLESAVAALRR